MHTTRVPAAGRKARAHGPLVLLLGLLVTSGCQCAIGEAIDIDGSLDTDMGTDSYVPPVDMGTDLGSEAGPPIDAGDRCGNGMIEGTELGEVCDPAYSIGSIPELRCQCPASTDICVNNVWVPDPVLGVCYGGCMLQARTDFMPTTCGTGVCAASGTTYCQNNQILDSCTPGTATGADDDCNGVDEDCDGYTDESYVPTPTSCGSGACAATGEMACSGGALSDTCVAGSPSSLDDDCDGQDDDCDGVPDDNFSPSTTTCGAGACASSGLSTCSNGQLGSTCTPGTPTGADDDCDNVDDDCDGPTDESFPTTPTTCGRGGCAATGATVCAHPVGGGAVIQDTCTPGTPQTEICDSIDNDCDGTVNDGNPGSGLACTTTLLGVCSQGTTTCTPAGLIQCVQNTMASIEICDGLDNDCNGTPDDIAMSSCGTGMPGVCAAGRYMCQGNMQVCVANTSASTEICDGLDNDCDGQVNEGNPGGGGTCGTGFPGVCSTGTFYCDQTVTSPTCRANIQPGTQQETCDGMDNDCEGSTDVNAYVNDGIGNTCGTAGLRTLNVQPNGTGTISGTVDPNGPDYVTVNFTMTGGTGSHYNPTITLTNDGGGTYVMNILGTTCNNLSTCAGDLTAYSALYPENPNACQANSQCTDQVTRTLTYVVRVKRKNAGNTNCTSYTLTATNPGP